MGHVKTFIAFTATVFLLAGCVSESSIPNSFISVSLEDADGSPTEEISKENPGYLVATLTDAGGNAVSGQTVTFSVSLGEIEGDKSAVSGKNGRASVLVTAGSEPGKGEAKAVWGEYAATTEYVTKGDDMDMKIVLRILDSEGKPLSVVPWNSTSVIMAEVTYTNDTPVSGVTVRFGSSLGILDNEKAETDDNGQASVFLVTGTAEGNGEVVADCGEYSAKLPFLINPPEYNILLQLQDSEGNRVSIISADSTGKLVATVTSDGMKPVPDETVRFATTSGVLMPSDGIAKTDSEGNAIIFLRTGPVGGIATVTATTTRYKGELDFYIEEPARVGHIVLLATLRELPADGTSESVVTAKITDQKGDAFADGERIGFTIESGSGSLGGPDGFGQTTWEYSKDGTASVTFKASTRSGTVTIRAAASNYESIFGTVTISLIEPVGSVTVAATPNTLTADGKSESTVTAMVLDGNGRPVPDGEIVYFSIVSGYGGLPDDSHVAAETKDGLASAVYKSSLSATTVTIQATAANYAARSARTTISFVSPDAARITLRCNPVSVKSDNSDSSVITATVTNADKEVLPNVLVHFSTGSGVLGDSSMVTDENGEATTVFSSGPDKSNRIATVDARTAETVTARVPVRVWGTGIRLTSDAEIVEIGGESAKLTIRVYDAGLNPVQNATVAVSVDSNPVLTTGLVIVNPVRGTTDHRGEMGAEITGTRAGTVTLNVQSSGASANIAYTVIHPDNDFFRIVSPRANPCSLTTGTDLEITVSAPDQSEVRFITTHGGWDGGGSDMVVKPVVDGSVTATLNSPDTGIGSVRVADAADPTLYDELGLVISVPSDAGDQISLKASSNVVQLSTGNLKYTVGLTATVRTSPASGGSVVGGVPVIFTIMNPTGGGENVQPGVVLTNDLGTASATFASGSLVSGHEGVTVRAHIADVPTVYDETAIVVGGIAGSVFIGLGDEVTVVNATTYSYPVSIMVVDVNGNPAENVEVSLGLWPIRYSTGYWQDTDPDPDKDDFIPVVTGTFDNEDTNENMMLDPGEDTNGDMVLTPPNSASGNVPATVVTNEYGIADFNLVYLKESSVWITDRLRARTFVSGTETTSSLIFRLPYEESEGRAGVLQDSPYN